VLGELRRRGIKVAARKPVQSGAPGGLTDADMLARATGEDPLTVCPQHRCYDLPLAPPMAAEALGRPAFTMAALLNETRWPGGVTVGLVEGVGGVRSPMSDDGDAVALIAGLGPDLVVLVAGAGLGVINLVRMSAPLIVAPLVVYLNGYHGTDDLHRRNRRWIEERLGLMVSTDPVDLAGRIVAPLGGGAVG
jgi:dethiobiotin synthetase